MANHPTNEELFDAHINQLEGPRGRDIHRHLEGCAECRQVLLDYQKLEQLFAEQPLEHPSASVLETISRRARQSASGGRRSTEKARERWLWALLRWDRAIGFAVVFVMAVGIGILYRSTEPDRTINGETAPMEQPPMGEIGSSEGRKAPAGPTPAPVTADRPSFPIIEKKESDAAPRIEAKSIALKKGKVVPADFEKPMAMDEAEAPPEGAPSGQADLAFKDEEKRTDQERPAGGMAPSLTVAPSVTVVPPMTEADKLFDKAQEARKSGKYAEASKRYEAVWRDYPDFARRSDLLFNWALCLEKLGRNSEAAGKLVRLKQMNPAYPGLRETEERINK